MTTTGGWKSTLAMQHHIYIQVPKAMATCIWKTWIWLSFLLECLMAWNTCADFICRATNWGHFQKVFFGISEASAVSTCRTTVWRNCPAESRRETMWIWYFLSSGSFRGLCPLVFQWSFKPGFVGFQTWVFLEGWRVGFLKNSEVSWEVLELWPSGLRRVKWRVAEEWGWEKVLEGSAATWKVPEVIETLQ